MVALRGNDYTAANMSNLGHAATTTGSDGTARARFENMWVDGLGEIDDRAEAAGGSVPSIRYAWDTGTTDADPGTGEVRGNNATIASITTIYASTSDADGASVSAILDTWDDSTSTVKGRLRLAHRTDATKWAEFTISAVTSATGYRKLTVSYVAGSGTLAAADPVALGFVAAGDKGDTGAATFGGGTAAAPGLAPSGDPDTGVYSDTANEVGMSAGGTGIVKAIAAGLVALSGYFNIRGSAGSNPSAGWMMDWNGGNARFLAPDGAAFRFLTAYGNEQMRVLHTASANRYITVTGSNGGDPTISTSGGALKIGVAARGTVVALTDGATITFDMALGNDAAVTLGGNRTFANPSNPAPGQAGSIFITQDGTGSRTLSFGSYWDFAGGTAPVLSTAAGAVDRLDYIVRTTTSIQAVLTKAYS